MQVEARLRRLERAYLMRRLGTMTEIDVLDAIRLTRRILRGGWAALNAEQQASMKALRRLFFAELT
jgi:hypothetical protein